MDKTTGYFHPVWLGVQNGICDFFNNPTLWSDEFMQTTMQRSGTKNYNIEDCRTIVKDYLTVLSEYVRSYTPTY